MLLCSCSFVEFVGSELVALIRVAHNALSSLHCKWFHITHHSNSTITANRLQAADKKLLFVWTDNCFNGCACFVSSSFRDSSGSAVPPELVTSEPSSNQGSLTHEVTNLLRLHMTGSWISTSLARLAWRQWCGIL
jgi:hypothetical protein